MADTTITLDEDLKDNRLSKYRLDSHKTWNETLSRMMNLLPDPGKFQEGCGNCGGIAINPYKKRDQSGIIQFYSAEHDGQFITGTRYFCSAGCAKEAQAEINAQFPTNPDAVIVGGRSEPRTVVEDATFYIDGEAREVVINVPGAFTGDYYYTGEPVYIENNDQIVQEGIIEQIAHEDVHTVLDLGHDAEITRLNHPDEEVRQEYEEHHAKWSDAECAACGHGFSYMVEEPPEECPECGALEW